MPPPPPPRCQHTSPIKTPGRDQPAACLPSPCSTTAQGCGVCRITTCSSHRTCTSSAPPITHEMSAMRAATSGVLVNNCGSPSTMLAAAPALAMASSAPTSTRRLAIAHAALGRPMVAGKNVCAACETASPKTAKNINTENVTWCAAAATAPRLEAREVNTPVDVAEIQFRV